MTEHNNEVIGKGKENVDDGSLKSNVRDRKPPKKYQDYVTFDKEINSSVAEVYKEEFGISSFIHKI